MVIFLKNGSPPKGLLCVGGCLAGPSSGTADRYIWIRRMKEEKYVTSCVPEMANDLLLSSCDVCTLYLRYINIQLLR